MKFIWVFSIVLITFLIGCSPQDIVLDDEFDAEVSSSEEVSSGERESSETTEESSVASSPDESSGDDNSSSSSVRSYDGPANESSSDTENDPSSEMDAPESSNDEGEEEANLDAPTELSLTPTENSITVVWVDNATSEAGYRIYIAAVDEKPKNIRVEIDADVTEYTIEDLLPGTNYYVWVAAYNDLGDEGESTTENALTISIHIERDDFTIVVIPDTQFMVLNSGHAGAWNDQYTAQTKWVYDNKDALNIKYVTHVGDVVENFWAADQWDRFVNGWQDVVASGIPWTIVPGNHDYSYDVPFADKYKEFNNYLGPLFQANTNLVETANTGQYENALYYFEAEGLEFMGLALSNDPTPDDMNWATQKMEENPDKRVLITLHSINGAPTLVDWAKNYPNIFMIHSGHDCANDWYHPYTNNEGGTIHEIMTDYQCSDNGMLRYYTFKPSQDLVEATTYSPKDMRYKTGGTSEFIFEYPMN